MPSSTFEAACDAPLINKFMNEEALATVKELKQDDARLKRAAFRAAIIELENDPSNLWFGGKPPKYEDIKRQLEFTISDLNRIFELEPEAE